MAQFTDDSLRTDAEEEAGPFGNALRNSAFRRDSADIPR
jgi:hypothetical protein